MTRMTLTTTLALALGGLMAAGACSYDRAPHRATASRWDTQDGDDRRVTRWEGQSTREIASPEGTGQTAEPERADTRALASTSPASETVAAEPQSARRGDVEEPDVERAPTTSAQASEEIDPDDDEAPLLEEATPVPPAVANPALAEIARDDPPADPLIADGFLRDEACPMELEGARVALVQRREGPALVFRSRDRDDLEELQSRVLSLALTKDDERVEEVVEPDTRPALAEEPRVQPPQDTESLDRGQAEMPHNLPSALSDLDAPEGRRAPIAVGEAMAPLPEAEVTVELTDDGAEMLFEPRTRGQRDDLTRQLTARAKALQEGECPANTMSMVTPAGQ